ncbi:MAG: ATP-binding cassette domain-containing protein [Sphaerochaetaceae bacterium]|nr:ATP-binding cassette domain-containing protein [Sphaerochaetaceae bacterium]
MAFVEFDKVSYFYTTKNGIIKAIDELSLDIEKGSFNVVVGPNGCGKSTLAKLLNALIIPTSGIANVGGFSLLDEENRYEIRKKVGLVFQNPDNQIVGDTVEEDIAFALENMAMPIVQMQELITQTMSDLGIENLRYSNPIKLSGGQKQLVCIASVLAFRPSCIVLDEATSMLDLDGRNLVLKAIRKLNKDFGITVILITHRTDEIYETDNLFIMDKGKIVIKGKACDVFKNTRQIEKIGIEVPPSVRLQEALRQRGFAHA